VRPPGAVRTGAGETLKEVEIPHLATSRSPNVIALAYTAHAVVILGEMK